MAKQAAATPRGDLLGGDDVMVAHRRLPIRCNGVGSYAEQSLGHCFDVESHTPGLQRQYFCHEKKEENGVRSLSCRESVATKRWTHNCSVSVTASIGGM